MKNKNHIKSPKQNSLRGIGKLGWTESGIMHSTIKRLISTFNTDKYKSSKNEKKEKCPACGRKFKVKNGKLPKHKTLFWLSDGWCDQKRGINVKITDLKEVTTNTGITLKVGDFIAFTIFNFSNYIYNRGNYSQFCCGKITKIEKYPYQNYLYLDTETSPISVYNVTKNLIFLTEEEYLNYVKNLKNEYK